MTITGNYDILLLAKEIQAGAEGDQLNRLPAIIAIILIIILAIASSCFYTVAPGEVGVVQCFGKYARTAYCGIRLKFPFEIEKVTKVPSTRAFTEEFGFRVGVSNIQSFYVTRGYENESKMIAVDLKPVDVQWLIQWRIRDPVNYLFRIRSPKAMVRKSSESIMQLVVGNYSIDSVFQGKREEICEIVHQLMQKALDDYESGIEIDRVKIKDVILTASKKPALNKNNTSQHRE